MNVHAVQPTLILTPRYTDDTQALWKTASRLGWSVERLSAWRVPAHLQQVPNPVLYAEALFAPSLAEQLGIGLSQPADDWLVHLPERYRQRAIGISTLAEARALTVPAFIKPPNDKSFPARVYAPGELPAGYDEAMPVLVSDIVRWTCEFRCFVLDRRLATYSIYARDGELQDENDYAMTDGERTALGAFMSGFLADSAVELPRATVVDIGIIAGRDGWAVIEQNAAWGAGLYGCDPGRALDVIRAAQSKEIAL
jgi:ATP-grasp domain, R2K clade family 2